MTFALVYLGLSVIAFGLLMYATSRPLTEEEKAYDDYCQSLEGDDHAHP